MSMQIRQDESDKLEVFLGKFEIGCKMAGEAIQREAAKVIKARVVGQLNRIRIKTNRADYRHMADDVQIRTVKDRFGETTTRVQGGAKTGTKWHLVNDGTYRSKATHFMDRALKEAETELQSVIDKELSKVGD